MGVIAAREQPGDDRISLQGDERRGFRHPAMQEAIALRGPASGELRLGKIGEHGVGGVRFRAGGAGVGPFFGQGVPCRFDAAFGLG